MEQLNEYRKSIPTRYIYLSFLIGIFINLIPSNNLIPDIVALLILYWLIVTPGQVGLFTVFVLGLFMDVATYSILGQHALAYVITSFLFIFYRRRIVLFNYGAQTILVLVVLFANQLIIYLSGYLYSNRVPPLDFFLPVIVGALLWPLLNKIMIIAYRPRKK